MTKHPERAPALPLQALLEPETLLPLNRRVLDKWLSLRGELRTLPRAAFSPREFAFALSHICVVEVHPGKDVIFRLCGTAITELLGRELTGASLRSFTPEEDWPYRISVFERILGGDAFVGLHAIPLAAAELRKSQELILPFADIAVGGSGQALIVNDFPSVSYGVRDEHPDETLGLTSDDRFYTL